MPELKGGCLCGAVRYTTTAEPVGSGVCHCRDCQRFTGSAFGALVYVSKEQLTVEGSMKTFASLGGSGKPMLRHFCPECGSTIAQEPGTRPGIVVLHIGTLDDPKTVTPAREIFCDDALPWVQTAGNMERFAKRPI
jgi:hypothetical protein